MITANPKKKSLKGASLIITSLHWKIPEFVKNIRWFNKYFNVISIVYLNHRLRENSILNEKEMRRLTTVKILWVIFFL